MASASEVTSSTLSSEQSLIRRCLRRRCTSELLRLIPQSDAPARGVWNDETIRTLTAIFELQRVELHSELEEEHIHNTIIAKWLEALTTREYFHDPCSDSLVLDMEAHCRLLASVLRTFKYHGKSLRHELHQEIYRGLNVLANVFQKNQSRRDEQLRVEDRTVAFLIKHCQYLLVSIDSDRSPARELARRAIVGFDGALAGLGQQYHELRPRILEMIQRQRQRPKWHKEYVELEDACWSVFASDIRMRSVDPTSNNDDRFVEEAEFVVSLLRSSLEVYLSQNPEQRRTPNILRQFVGQATDILQDAGPFEEHPDYFLFGILDLLYQLSFRIRKHGRKQCFVDYMKIIRLTLEHRRHCKTGLHLKATDLWFRLIILGNKDREVYGDEEDRLTISKWLNQNPRAGVELFEFSEQ
jgi:hypothetical protein